MNFSSMLFDGWGDLVRVAVVGIAAYAGLVFLLRITGKRTLAKMNMFDFVVTVALGSILATILLNSDVSLSEGLLAFAVLCLLQYVVAEASVRFKWFQRVIKAEPTLLFYRGKFLPKMLAKERVTEEEVYAAMRSKGLSTVVEVGAVVLETDGSFSVVGAANEPMSALQNVKPAPS